MDVNRIQKREIIFIDIAMQYSGILDCIVVYAYVER